MAYEKAISHATGETDPRALAEIEEHMRHTIFHSTLDWQTKRQFNAGARRAYQLYVTLAANPTDEQITRAFKVRDPKHVPALRTQLAQMREEATR